MAISSPRLGAPNALRRLLGRAIASDLRAFVVPGAEHPRLAGIDLLSAGLRIAHTPRHANVLIVVDPIPKGLEPAATVAYAQMPRPRAILLIGDRQPATLPDADVTVEPKQSSFDNGVVELRRQFASSAFSSQVSAFDDRLFRTRTDYTCPMHPEVVSEKPGQCPICGMDLVPREAEADRPEHTATHHDNQPHHPDERPHHPSHGEHNQIYTCPMHPEVAEPQPGTCPICHMRLEPRAGAGGHESSDMTEHSGHDSHGGEHGHSPIDHAKAPEPTEGAHESHATTGEMDHSEHAGHGGGGFMSMVAMTSDLPRSRDGLPMEWLDVSFGPLFPGLPGGLALTLTLDGDVVAGAEIRAGTCQRQLADWAGPRNDLPDHLKSFDRLAPGAYSTLAYRALGQIDDAIYVQALERARMVSHLGWLASFCSLIGLDQLGAEASRLQLVIVRAHATEKIVAMTDEIVRYTGRFETIPLLTRRLRGVGRFEKRSYDGLAGPIARAAGVHVDSRIHDPAYHALDFKPVTEQDNDALARLLVRLAEIRQSVEFVGASDQFLVQSVGHGQAKTASCEMPRGRASLTLDHGDGEVKIARIDSPSARLADLVSEVTVGHEIGDALVAIASLDLSPWELDG